MVFGIMCNKDNSINGPLRMNKFATFFSGYMGSAPVIAAALPIPITAGKIIPTYAEYTGFLTTYTSMFCFMAVALIFYRRHRIGMYLMPEWWEKESRIIGRFIISWLPLILIGVTLICIVIYHSTLTLTLNSFTDAKGVSTKEILSKNSPRLFEYHIQVLLILSYLGIFISSTVAFALMAVREYMQNVLNLNEYDLVIRTRDPFHDNETNSVNHRAEED